MKKTRLQVRPAPMSRTCHREKLKLVQYSAVSLLLLIRPHLILWIVIKVIDQLLDVRGLHSDGRPMRCPSC